MGGGLETKLLNETEQPPIFRSAHPAINLFFFFFFSLSAGCNTSRVEHAGPHKEAAGGGIRASDVIATLPGALSCVCVFVCVCVCADLIRFQEHLVRGFEMQVSTRRKSVFIRAQTHVLPDASRHLE